MHSSGPDPQFYAEDTKRQYMRKYRRPFLFNPGGGFCRFCNQPIQCDYKGGGAEGWHNHHSTAFHSSCWETYDRQLAQLREGMTA